MPRPLQVRLGITLLAVLLVIPVAHGADISKETMAKYLLLTIHAFRTVYVDKVLPHIERGGVVPKERWEEDPHAVMLPFQFVKLAGAMIREFDMGLVSLTPIYASNFPKTAAEVSALKSILEGGKTGVVTFMDAGQAKGLMADLAIEQSCVDCHNHHPKSPRRDFKKGDLIGAIVVRLKN